MTRNVDRLRPTPPEPTPEKPYAQLDWLGAQFVRRYQNEKTRYSVLKVVGAFKKYYQDTKGYGGRSSSDSLFFLAKDMDQFVLYNVRHYWLEQGLASFTIAHRVRVMRRLLKYAVAKGYVPIEVFSITMWEGKRETKQREGYEDAELDWIRKLISEKVRHSAKVAADYQRKEIGADPRVGFGMAKGAKGWKHWGNIVWYFENVLNCRPFLATRANLKTHRSFCYAAAQYHAGLANVWLRLGVSPLIDSNLIVPLAIKLAWETGLNPESVLNLRRDCFQEFHPLTGQPYLAYYKERSTGNKQLHLSLLDSKNSKAQPTDLQLRTKQSIIIGRTIALAKILTEPLVTDAKAEDREYLFLLQPRTGGRAGVGSVLRLNTRLVTQWTLRVRRDSGVGVPFSFNLSRFRPTKITQMVREGYDFFQIQAVAGHANTKTTALYLAKHQLNPQAQREVSQTLIRIHENQIEFERDPKPYARTETGVGERFITKGVIADCKNVLEPPDWVKRLSSYRPGQPCTLWNMCLLCPNVLITRKHLPLLVAYDREILASIERNNLGQAPNATQYRKIRAVLAGIFEDFGPEAMRWATQIAENADDHLDAVTYRGVNYRASGQTTGT